MEKTEKPVFEPMPETPAEPASTVSESAGQPAASLAEAKKNILVGLLWCVGGLAFSFISYYFTKPEAVTSSPREPSSGVSGRQSWDYTSG